MLYRVIYGYRGYIVVVKGFYRVIWKYSGLCRLVVGTCTIWRPGLVHGHEYSPLLTSMYRGLTEVVAT